MGKSTAPAPMPDFAGMMAAQAAQQAAREQAAVAREQLAWAREEYDRNQQQIQPILDRMTRGMDQQYDFTRQQQDFYTGTYQPIEADFADQAMNWDTQGRRDQRAGEAAADVAQQFEGARQAAAQQLRDFGVDPTSGRYAATDLASRVSQAASAAGAQNMARRQVEQEGLGLKQAAINIGRGYPGNVNAGYGGSAATGQGAVGGFNQTMQTGSQMMGNPTQWMAGSNQALGTWGNIANNNYANYMQGYQIQNAPQSSGWGSALGLAGGILASRFADGGAIPLEASPSGGEVTDDVPAALPTGSPIRLDGGEFIVPREAVSWLGEKAMHDLIIKAQKERMQVEQQSGAVPDVMPANSNSPQSRAALPVR